MKNSNNRIKGLIVTFGLSFWFFIITNSIDIFSIELFGIFISITIILTQVFVKSLSTILEKIAVFNTKLFLGGLFVTVISLYGIFMRILGIDLLRLKEKNSSYWLDIEEFKTDSFFKQY